MTGPDRAHREADRPPGRSELWLGVVIGLLAALPLFFLARYTALEEAEQAIWIAGLVAVGAAIAVLVAYLIFRRLLKTALGHERPSLTTTIDSVTDAAVAAADGRGADAIRHAGQAAGDIAAAYSWLTLRSWVAGIALAALALFAGSVTTLLLFEQNAILSAQRSLLDEQNKRLQAQIDLAGEQLEQARRQSVLMAEQSRLAASQILAGEAQRRLPLYARLSDVVARIRAEAAAARGAPPPTQAGPPTRDRATPVVENGLVVLTEGTAAEITFLAEVLRPYHYADPNPPQAAAATPDDPYADLRISENAPLIFASYERGLLFQTLTQATVDLNAIGTEVGPLLDLRRADLRDAVLRPLVQVTSGACDRNAPVEIEPHGYPVENANLAGAQFQGAQISDIDFYPLPPGRVPGTQLSGADFSGSTLFNLDLPIPEGVLRMQGARLVSVKFSLLSGADSLIDIDGAVLGNVCLDWPRQAPTLATGPFIFDAFTLDLPSDRRSVAYAEYVLVHRLGFDAKRLHETVALAPLDDGTGVLVQRLPD